MTLQELKDKTAIIESLGPVLGKYYPTVKEMEAMKIQDKKEDFLPLITYLSLDPLEGGKETFNTEIERKEYRDVVLYARDLYNSYEDRYNNNKTETSLQQA